MKLTGTSDLKFTTSTGKLLSDGPATVAEESAIKIGVTMSDHELPFGLRLLDSQMVDVTEVDSGLACGCVCPQCKSPLQAKKGLVREHHFSHHASDEHSCVNALETVIHLMAKQILEEERGTRLPGFQVSEAAKDRFGFTLAARDAVIELERRWNFTAVILETMSGDVRPDIIASDGQQRIIIEIAVTHFVDEVKRAKLKEKRIRAVEINLRKVDRRTTKHELKRLLIDELDNKKWIFHPDEENIRRKLKDEIALAIASNDHPGTKDLIAAPELKSPELKLMHRRPAPNHATILNKQYNPRWFLCEACRYIFSVPLSRAPYSIQRIECPECSHDVSTN